MGESVTGIPKDLCTAAAGLPRSRARETVGLAGRDWLQKTAYRTSSMRIRTLSAAMLTHVVHSRVITATIT
jgi:hypothetical protein